MDDLDIRVRALHRQLERKEDELKKAIVGSTKPPPPPLDAYKLIRSDVGIQTEETRYPESTSSLPLTRAKSEGRMHGRKGRGGTARGKVAESLGDPN